jgi:hypothetical protein
MCVCIPDDFLSNDIHKPCFGIACGPNGYCDRLICKCNDGYVGIRCEYKSEEHVAATNTNTRLYTDLHCSTVHSYCVHSQLFVFVCLLSLFFDSTAVSNVSKSTTQTSTTPSLPKTGAQSPTPFHEIDFSKLGTVLMMWHW